VRSLLTALILSVALLCSQADAAPSWRSGGSRIPAPARGAGYTVNTFSTESSFTSGNVDMGLTYASGYQWYFWNFFDDAPDSSGTTLESNGTASVFQTSSNATLVSAAQISSAPYFVGTAFGGGGYFEAEIAFDPKVSNASLAWPAWWMMSLEHLYDFAAGNGNEQWPGQVAGYSHFMEVDTFEYDRTGQPYDYGGTLHDWFGLYNVTCPGGYCGVDSDFNASTAKTPIGTDWTILHRLAVLWIPATSIAQGSYTFYFDDIAVAGPFTYSQYTSQGPPPTTSTPWTFGIGDQQHLVLILGSGWSPLLVRSVNVWQASSAGNIHN
jgi:hypothetical protein